MSKITFETIQIKNTRKWNIDESTMDINKTDCSQVDQSMFSQNLSQFPSRN